MPDSFLYYGKRLCYTIRSYAREVEKVKKCKRLMMLMCSLLFIVSMCVQNTVASSTMQSLFDETMVVHGSEQNGKKAVYGIDVSKWQGTINWTRVKNAGIEFAIIRIGYSSLTDGTPTLDPTYNRNIQAAKAAGVKVGVYYYSQATNAEEARQEVDFVMQHLNGTSLDLPVVYDAECGTVDGKPGKLGAANLSKSEWTKVAVAFCDAVAARGYTPMFYGSISKIINKIDYKTIDSRYQMWIARYKYKGDTSPHQLVTTNYPYSGKYEIWQYSDHGVVDGISGYVDLDIMYVPASSPYKGTVYYNSQKVGNGSGLTATATGTSINLKWKSAENASSYAVYRSEVYSKSYKKIASVEGTSYTDANRVQNKEYYYYVVPQGVINGSIKSGSASSKVRAYCSGQSLGNMKTNISVALRQEANSSTKQLVKMPKNASVITYCQTKGTDGNVWFKVKYTKGKKSYVGYVLGKRVNPSVSKITSLCKKSCTDSTVTIKWKKSSGATGYQIYKSTARNGKYTRIATVKGDSNVTYTVTGLQKNTIYYYKVRAYKTICGKTAYSDYVLNSGGTTANPATTVKAKKADKLRQYAGTAYKSLVKVPKNASLKVVYTTRDNKNRVWYKVQYKKGKKTYTGFFLKANTK